MAYVMMVALTDSGHVGTRIEARICPTAVMIAGTT
jgi:hypothetical protein